MHHHKYRLIIPFLLPAILLYGIFVVWPYAQAIYISLTSWRGVSGNKPFVGLDNYQRLWEDGRFVEALTRNGQLLIVLPLVTIAIALTFAALFTQGSQQIRGAGFYRIVFFFPQIIPAVIVGILWSYIYTPNIGLLNGILRATGLGDVSTSWLTDPGTVLWAIAAVAIWSSVGFYMVIFLASMQSIPTSFIYLAIAALDFFILIVVISGGSTTTTARRAEVAAIYLYNQAFDSSRWGYASAIGVVLLILTLFLSLGIMRVTRRETYEF